MNAYQYRFWRKAIKSLILAGTVAAAVTVVSPGGLEGQTSDPCNSSRFKCVMGSGAAVRDHKTGLIWERSPASTRHSWTNVGIQSPTTNDARGECTSRTTGGRKGWRLPSVDELASLMGPSKLIPVLPPGHPFSNGQSASYWSATTNEGDPTLAWVVDFSHGLVVSHDISFPFKAWCVRGDAY